MKTKILLSSMLVFIIVFVSYEAVAQSDIALATKKANLQALSEKLKKRDTTNRQQVLEFARRMGIPARRELPNGKVFELQRVSPDTGPIFYVTNNAWAADTVSTLQVWPEGSTGLNLDGSGLTVGEWDAGSVYEHPDYAGRLTIGEDIDLLDSNEPSSISNHATHVAGTLVGDGLFEFGGFPPDPGEIARGRGMAYAAHLEAYDWNSDTQEMTDAAALGMLVSNHSYGIAAGWLYIGDIPPDTWWWIGGAGVEDPNFGYYDGEAQLWDQIAYDAPYYLIVKAAGNDRTDTGPTDPNEEYTIIDQNGTSLGTSTRGLTPRNDDCWPGGYDCLPSHSVAKNILTVGAVNDLPGGYIPLVGPSQVTMLPFSGWGPTDDGRIKPDVVGNGEFLFSTWADNPFYNVAAGTSMAAPNVTGSMLLLQEHYENVHVPDNFMRAATLKALVIHTADEAGDADGPDYEFGWGLMNTKKAAKVITEDVGGGDHQIIEGSLANGTVDDTIQINVAEANTQITATLVWTDPAGTPVALSIDPTDTMLVNDLDLRIKKGATYSPWVLNPAAPSAAATKGDNFRDNVEQVEIASAGTGNYTIEISHKGTLSGGANQNYSLIISKSPPLPTGGLLIDEDFSGGMPAGWSVDTVRGRSWAIFTPINATPSHPVLDNWAGTGEFAMVDNEYNNTITSLVMPSVDLSTATTVLLRCNLYFPPDFLQTFNVDVSTDGGASWVTDVWVKYAESIFPSQHTIDITGATAGYANVKIRLRFDSGGDPAGELVQIDDVQLEVIGGGTPTPGNPPGPASNPNPADGSIELGLNMTLAWTTGADAISHNVFFDTSSPPAYLGNQTGTSFDPGALANDMTYYWRIDEQNNDGTTTGVTWSFTTEAAPVLPGQASNPSPIDGASSVGISADLSWTAGSDTTSHIVFFNGVSQGSQTGTTFDPGALAYATTYNWRIDEVNGNGTTAGSTWSFTTEAAPVLPPGQASNPSPIDGASSVGISADLSWTAGSDTTSHIVFFNGVSQGSQTGTTFDPGALAYATTYNWRIDEVNGNGTTAGSTWSFTSEAAPVGTMHLTGLNGGVTSGSRGRWNADVNIIVEDQGDSPEAGVTVDGSWSNGASGGATCVTNGTGLCTVTKSNLKKQVSSVTFTVNNLTKTGSDYSQADNVVADSIIVSQGSANQTPIASNDSYQSDVNVLVSGNVIDNDVQGDGPASISSNTQSSNGVLTLNIDGEFTYTPNIDFEGSDSFTYNIVDLDGDISNTAIVSITVADVEPPPPSGPSISLRPFKVKGLQYVEVMWLNYSGSTVAILRDGSSVDASPTENDGSYEDNIGVKGSGQIYTYEVCETGTSNCVSAVTGF